MQRRSRRTLATVLGAIGTLGVGCRAAPSEVPSGSTTPSTLEQVMTATTSGDAEAQHQAFVLAANARCWDAAAGSPAFAGGGEVPTGVEDPVVDAGIVSVKRSLLDGFDTVPPPLVDEAEIEALLTRARALVDLEQEAIDTPAHGGTDGADERGRAIEDLRAQVRSGLAASGLDECARVLGR